MAGTERIRKHCWSKFEDAKLVECLVHIVHEGGWRSDNGTFRSGYLAHLLRMLKGKIQNCSVESTNTIDCRVRTLKRQYTAIAEMLGSGCSGFGWNEEFKCVDVERDIFDLWVKSHHSAKGLRNKPFPHFDELAFVFGKDRATGAGAETPGDMASNDVEPLDADVEMGVSQEHYVPEPPIFDGAANPNEEENPGTPTSRLQRSATMSHGSKRKCSSYQSEMLDIFRSAMDMQNTQLERIASWPQSNFTLDDSRRTNVSDTLKELTPPLSQQERITLMDIIFTNPMKTSSFLSVPMEDKRDYCMFLLGRRE